MTYDDWLRMSDEERDAAHLGWNTYGREYVWVPAMAAARFAMNSPVPVVETAVGTYHCGEYLLHLTVRRRDFDRCPPSLSQRFEGFRVVWLPEPGPPDDLHEHPLIGSWKSTGSSGDYQIDIGAEAGRLSVQCKLSSSDEALSVEFPNCMENTVQFFTTCNGVEQRHDLSYEDERDHPDCMRHEITTYRYVNRRKDASKA